DLRGGATSPAACSPPALHDALPISRDAPLDDERGALDHLLELERDGDGGVGARREDERKEGEEEERARLSPHGARPFVRCRGRPDRKSTRLNSSHVKTSYAVFCLKK